MPISCLNCTGKPFTEADLRILLPTKSTNSKNWISLMASRILASWRHSTLLLTENQICEKILEKWSKRTGKVEFLSDNRVQKQRKRIENFKSEHHLPETWDKKLEEIESKLGKARLSEFLGRADALILPHLIRRYCKEHKDPTKFPALLDDLISQGDHTVERDTKSSLLSCFLDEQRGKMESSAFQKMVLGAMTKTLNTDQVAYKILCNYLPCEVPQEHIDKIDPSRPYQLVGVLKNLKITNPERHKLIKDEWIEKGIQTKNAHLVSTILDRLEDTDEWKTTQYKEIHKVFRKLFFENLCGQNRNGPFLTI